MDNGFFKAFFIINALITVGLLIYVINSHNIEIDFSNEVLKVRGLVVTDSIGTERVIIGAPLPPPQSVGYRFYRGDNSGVSGIILYDHEGQERGSYVTDNSYGNIFFTLDSKTDQHVLFIAEPQGAATLRMWGDNGNEIDLGTSDDGIRLNVSEYGNKRSLIKEN